MSGPLPVTIPGAAVGQNAKLSVLGYGSITARVETIAYSVEVSFNEAEAASYKVYYPGWLQDSGFSIEMLFLTAAERDAMNDWIRGYMVKVTNGTMRQGSMLVGVPTRNFLRQAVPLGTLPYGDSKSQDGKAYRITLVFAGATNPLSIASASSFTDNQKAPFYPSSSLVAGAESLAGTIFDDVNGATSLAQVAAIVQPPHINKGLM